MRLLMKCGHDITIDANKVASVACWCGEAIVARTLGAPRPNFTGHARGAGVESKFLGPKEDLDLTTDGPLVLKPDVEPRLITIGELVKAVARTVRRRKGDH